MGTGEYLLRVYSGMLCSFVLILSSGIRFRLPQLAADSDTLRTVGMSRNEAAVLKNSIQMNQHRYDINGMYLVALSSCVLSRGNRECILRALKTLSRRKML